MTCAIIRILEKFSRASGVKSGVPSSMKLKSVKYMPRYGIHGGSHRCNTSRIARNRPSEQMTACSFVIVCLIWIGGGGDTLCRTLPKHSPRKCTHRFRHLVPGLLQPVHSRIGEGCADLQNPVEIVQAAANVGHRSPFLDGRHSGRHIAPGETDTTKTVAHQSSVIRSFAPQLP